MWGSPQPHSSLWGMTVQTWAQRLRGRRVGAPSQQARELGFALLPEVVTKGTVL